MPDVPIVQTRDRAVATIADRLLPVGYMNDFSVMGLQVEDCARAATILGQHAYGIRHGADGTYLNLTDRFQLLDAIALLRGQGLVCDMADVVRGIYQG